jgi:hypothetical protein
MMTTEFGLISSQTQSEQRFANYNGKEIAMFSLRDTKGFVNYPVAINIRQLPPHIENLTNITMKAIKLAKADGRKINIIVTGSSGLIIGTLLWQKLTTKGYEVLMTHIRKDVTGHHGSMFESLVPHDKWHETFNIITDDFVATGSTVQRIFAALGLKIEFLDGILIDNFDVNTISHAMKRLSFIAS